MSRDLILKQCKKCKNTIKVINDKKCDLICCGDVMEEIIPNTFDAAFEKHIPNYEIQDENIIVTVNHVMEDEHYIEWISMHTENKEYMVYFKPGEVPTACFPYIKGASLYAYCNKHALWKKEVE